ncbi:MAG: SoxY-related AACIE arm protein [Geminicoccaceae bacterium]
MDARRIQGGAGTDRRAILRGAAGVAVTLIPAVALATPEEVEQEIRALFGERAIEEGRVVLEIPPLAENGNSVPLTVSVPDSPMTAEDHVRSISVFAEHNPLPVVGRFFMGPRSGQAEISTRIRLADSQTLLAVAEMSDGSLFKATAETIVTLAACIDLS